MMNKVEIPKSLLFGLLGFGAVAALGVVFLLGRASGQRPPVEFQVKTAAPAPPAGPSPEPAPAAAIPRAEATSPTPLERADPSPISGSPAPGGTGTDTVPLDSTRAAVASYFHSLERIQPGAIGDPETLAQQVVGGLGKGDSSGFEAMIHQAEATRSRLAAITPPQPCAGHHRESLACLDASLDLMHAMAKGLASGEPDPQLANLSTRANALKARSESLQLQEKVLRERFGLMR